MKAAPTSCCSRLGGHLPWPCSRYSENAVRLQIQHASVADPTSHALHQFVVRNAVEIPAQVRIDHNVEGRLMQPWFSEPARHSRKFWPDNLLNRPRRPIYVRGFLWFGYLHQGSDCYRLERLLAGWDSHPLNNSAFARRTHSGTATLVRAVRRSRRNGMHSRLLTILVSKGPSSQKRERLARKLELQFVLRKSCDPPLAGRLSNADYFIFLP